MLCKEENVRAGRDTAAGKMRETVAVTVHKGILEIMDRNKIMDDRDAGNRRILDTAKKMAEEGYRVAMDNREVMASKAITASGVIMAAGREATGASMKGMEACRAVLADMGRKANMARAVMADSRVDMADMVAMASRAAGVASREVTDNRADMAAMASRAVMDSTDRVKMTMTMTIVVCRDAIAVGKKKTLMRIIAAMKMIRTIMTCRAIMAKKEKKVLMKMKTGITTGNNNRNIPAGVLAACSTTRTAACMAWAINTNRNMNMIMTLKRTITGAGKIISMKKGIMVAGRRATAIRVWAAAAMASRAVVLPVCPKKKYAA